MHTKKTENKQTTNKINTCTHCTVKETNSNIGLVPDAQEFFCISLQGKTAMGPIWFLSQAATLPTTAI